MDSRNSSTPDFQNLIPAGGSGADNAGADIVLSEADVDAIQAAADSAMAPATRRAYRSLWNHFAGLARQNRAGSQRQAKGLSRTDLAAIRATACRPPHRTAVQDRPDRRGQGPLDLARLHDRARADRQPADAASGRPRLQPVAAASPRPAGLGSGYSGHSPRVGAAQALAATNISLAAIMEHGRWQSLMMPARYTRHAAAQSAMARLYAQGR